MASPVEAAQAAMKIAAGAAEEQSADRGQHRIAQIAVQRRHCARQDPAAKAVAHDQLITGAQLLDKSVKAAEIIAVVAVAHDHVFAMRRANAAEQSAAISAVSDMNHAGAVRRGDRRRAIAAAIVSDHNLACEAAAGEEAACFAYTCRQSLGFIQARHQNG